MNNKYQKLNNVPIHKSIKCENTVIYGGIDICFSDLDGMSECSKDSIMRPIIDLLNTSPNRVLAYYMNNESYKKIDEISESTQDDFLIFFGSKKYENNPVTKDNLNRSAESLIGLNWEVAINKAEEKYDSLSLNLSIGKPVFLEAYSLNENVKSIVMLSKFILDKEEGVRILIINVILIEDRLISANYNMNYDGIESVKIAKGKNDYFILQFIEANKL